MMLGDWEESEEGTNRNCKLIFKSERERVNIDHSENMLNFCHIYSYLNLTLIYY